MEEFQRSADRRSGERRFPCCLPISLARGTAGSFLPDACFYSSWEGPSRRIHILQHFTVATNTQHPRPHPRAPCFCESSLLRINQRHHSLQTRLWHTPPAAVRKPTEESTRERGLGVGLGRDSRYGSIYVCPPPPRDPAPWCSPRPPSPSPSIPGIPHPQLVPLGAGVGRRACRVHRA